MKLLISFISRHRSTLLAGVLTLAPSLRVPAGEYRITEVQPVPGTFEAKPTKINDHGEVIGYSLDERIYSRPFVYRNGVTRDLFPPEDTGYALDINNAGQIVAI